MISHTSLLWQKDVDRIKQPWVSIDHYRFQIARYLRPTLAQRGADRFHVGPTWGQWILLSGFLLLAELFIGNIDIYKHFATFPYTTPAQVVEIFPSGRQDTNISCSPYILWMAIYKFNKTANVVEIYLILGFLLHSTTWLLGFGPSDANEICGLDIFIFYLYLVISKLKHLKQRWYTSRTFENVELLFVIYVYF